MRSPTDASTCCFIKQSIPLCTFVVLAGCAGPWFGPGGYDQAKIENGASPARIQAFKQLDRNHNGTIDATEARSAPDQLNLRFEALDTNQDRHISEAEFLKRAQPL